MDDNSPYQLLPNPYQTGQVARFTPMVQQQQADDQAPPTMLIPQTNPSYNYTVPQAQPEPQRVQPTLDDNVLNTVNRQEALGKAFDLATDIINKGEQKPSRLMDIIGAVGQNTGGLVGAVARGITAKRQLQERQQQEAYRNLINLSNVVGTTHIKPLTNMVKENRLAEEEQRRKVKDQMLDTYNNRKLEVSKQHYAQIDQHNTNLEGLKKYGIDTSSWNKEQTRNLLKAHYDQTDSRVRDLAALQSYLTTHRDDQKAQLAYASARHAMDKDQAQFESDIGKHNSAIQTKLLERDKDGNYKYRDEKGQPIDPTPYMLQLSGFKNQLPEINPDTTAQDAISRYTQPEPIQTSEAPSTPPRAEQRLQNDQIASAVQSRIKQFGMSKFQALGKFVEAAKRKGYSEDEGLALARQAGL